MTKQEIFQGISQNPAFYLSTLEGDQPRVRGMLLYRADESGILFHTAVKKDVYHQLKANSKVELLFNVEGMQIRIAGQVNEVKSNELKDEIVEDPSRGFLKSWKESGAFEDFYQDIAVFSMENAMASVWTMAGNFQPKEYIEL